MENSWTTDIENILEGIRVNCIILTNEHKERYFSLKENLKYYRLPVIIISGINSIISVGLQPYLAQGAISITTCLLALSCSIIGSVELYLGIQKSMEIEMISQRELYLLGVDIYKTLKLTRENRQICGKDYLEKCYNDYCNLIESSNAVAKKLEDKLCPLPSMLSNDEIIRKNSNLFDKSNLDIPKLDTHKLYIPKLDTPKLDTPKLDTPKLDTLKLDTPKLDIPKLDMPKLDVLNNNDISIDIPVDNFQIIVDDTLNV